MSSQTQKQYVLDDYTIACICPMGIELAPVLAMLDETHPPLRTHREQNAYQFGSMAGHNMVVVVLPQIGNNAAATVASQLLNDFTSIRFGLLVGIGGGVPRDGSEDDVHLGDVVVSKPQATFGGVVQYDLGKKLADGSFQRTGTLNRPPPLLSASVQILEALHLKDGDRICSYLDDMLDRYPLMRRRYSRPTESDVLFQPSYVHSEGAKTCKECDQDRVVVRVPRQESKPYIHYGTIASASLLIKSAADRDALSREMNVLCIEMEAAGIMNDFPCLVIRGISDYADSHKNDEWQPYAAAVAAAYMKELLSTILPRGVLNADAATNDPTIYSEQRSASAQLPEIPVENLRLSDSVNLPEPRSSSTSPKYRTIQKPRKAQKPRKSPYSVSDTALASRKLPIREAPSKNNDNFRPGDHRTSSDHHTSNRPQQKDAYRASSSNFDGDYGSAPSLLGSIERPLIDDYFGPGGLFASKVGVYPSRPRTPQQGYLSANRQDSSLPGRGPRKSPVLKPSVSGSTRGIPNDWSDKAGNSKNYIQHSLSNTNEDGARPRKLPTKTSNPRNPQLDRVTVSAPENMALYVGSSYDSSFITDQAAATNKLRQQPYIPTEHSIRLMNVFTWNVDRMSIQEAGGKYAILSHELSKTQIRVFEKESKLRPFTEAIEKVRSDGLRYIWIDHYCPDLHDEDKDPKETRYPFPIWLQRAAVCYVYLEGLRSGSESQYRSQLKGMAWFGHAWRLQDLLIPSKVCFFNREWDPLGSKIDLATYIQEATGINERFLKNDFRTACIAEKLSWGAKRYARHIEDKVFCMQGILDINQERIYGKPEKVFARLLYKLIAKYPLDESIYAWRLPGGARYDALNGGNQSYGLMAPWITCFEASQDIELLPKSYWKTEYAEKAMSRNGESIDVDWKLRPLSRRLRKQDFDYLALRCWRDKEIFRLGIQWFDSSGFRRIDLDSLFLGEHRSLPEQTYNGGSSRSYSIPGVVPGWRSEENLASLLVCLDRGGKLTQELVADYKYSK